VGERHSRARSCIDPRGCLLTLGVTRLLLSCEDWQAEVAPHIGGSLLSLSRAGRSILRSASDDAFASGAVRGTACYPLIPYANRIARGRFQWNGVEHHLDKNFPASPHPLHGVGWRRPWQIVRSDAQCCELQLKHRPLENDQCDWPFAFDAKQIISLRSTGLQISLSVVNVGEWAAPLGIGLHPLFPRKGSQRLIFASAGAWRNGADMLPSDEIDAGLWDHVDGQRIGEQALDNDFFGWSGTARIESDRAPAISITADPIFSALRVFTPPGQAFFALEPVSHITDAINRTSVSGAGMYCAQPGGELGGTVYIDSDPPL
jgi:aldose 1-epimerase